MEETPHKPVRTHLFFINLTYKGHLCSFAPFRTSRLEAPEVELLHLLQRLPQEAVPDRLPRTPLGAGSGEFGRTRAVFFWSSGTRGGGCPKKKSTHCGSGSSSPRNSNQKKTIRANSPPKKTRQRVYIFAPFSSRLSLYALGHTGSSPSKKTKPCSPTRPPAPRASERSALRASSPGRCLRKRSA